MLKDVFHEDFSKDSALNEIIRRSISRDVSQEKSQGLRRSSRVSAAARENKEAKRLDGISEVSPKAKPTPKLQTVTTLRSILISYIGNLIGLVAFPAIVLLLHLACTRDQCTLTKFHIPRNWRVYLNLEAAEIVLGFVLSQAILMLLPIGRNVGGQLGRNGTLIYRCNGELKIFFVILSYLKDFILIFFFFLGLLSTFLTVAGVAGLWYYKIPVTIVYEKLLPLLVSSAALGYLLSITLFIKGGRAPVPGLNPEGITGNRLHQFLVGREVNPILFKRINVKTLLIRTLTNGTVSNFFILAALSDLWDINFILTFTAYFAWIIGFESLRSSK